MRRQDALFIALAAGTIAFAAAFAYPAITPEPVLWYYPVEHHWAFEVKPTGVAMDFYGRTLQGAVAWAIAAAIAWLVTRKISSASARAIGMLGGWALAMTLLVMLDYGWTLYHRVPKPAPIPSWYKPR